MTQSAVQAPTPSNQQRKGLARRWPTTLSGAVVLLAAAQFVAVAGAGMIAYPGGNEFDSASQGYAFWFNTLSDLGKSVATGGRHNELWALSYNLSLVAVMLALAPLWLSVPGMVRRGRKAAVAAAALGMASAVGGAMVGALPSGKGCGHAVAIGLASMPGLLALAIAASLMLSNRFYLPGVLGMLLLAAGLVHFGQYVAHFWLGGGWTPAAPATQKVAAMIALAWMIAMGVAICHGRRRQAAPQ